jgi:acyl-CoA thioester hydrolase
MSSASESGPAPAPFDLHRETVLPEWVDYNGHMNLAYYLLAFDHASDRMFDFLDLGVSYIKRTNCSLFALETHVTYERELKAGEPLRCTSQLVDHDAKRVQLFHMMYHATEGYLAATNEILSIHVDLGTRRSRPFPPDVARRFAWLMEEHGKLPRPAQVGRAIRIKRGG